MSDLTGDGEPAAEPAQHTIAAILAHDDVDHNRAAALGRERTVGEETIGLMAEAMRAAALDFSHATCAAGVPEQMLLDQHLWEWHRERDLLPGETETVIGADSTKTDTVLRIMQERGLDQLPPMES